VADTHQQLAAEVWGSVLQVQAALVPEFDRRLREAAGLPLTWYDVLLELSAVESHRLTMGHLGERVVLSRSRVSRVVDDMAEAGLVRRESHPEDARSSYAVLTDAGMGKFREAAPIYVAAIDDRLSGLRAPELKNILGAMRHILETSGGARDRRAAR
jgi:DNA-binding MarR family transcriptional regulator